MPIQYGPDYVRAIAPYQGGKPIAEVAREFGHRMHGHGDGPWGMHGMHPDHCDGPMHEGHGPGHHGDGMHDG